MSDDKAPPNTNPPHPRYPNLRPWRKGQPSPNPGGRTKTAKFRKLIRKLSPQALEALRAALAEPGERVTAAKVILEFSWGKAPSAAELAQLESRAASAGKEVREDLLEELSDALAEGSGPN